MQQIKLTQYSHGAGCGCKISPKVLDQILKSNLEIPQNEKLIVGNHTKDDAAVYDLGNGTGLISTTDFFMPIVDDPFSFGKIASANAISDVYAMGGTPVLAIAILGWPINTIAAEVAQQVINGARTLCAEAGIALAGGHSIDSPEPIFGLAVNGLVKLSDLKQNNTATDGNLLFLTKPIGVGILTTAEKKGLLEKEHEGLAARQMMQLNKIGAKLSQLKAVKAMTDVTGFGLLGHLCEMCEGSNLNAEVYFDAVPLITNLDAYLDKKAIPGGTNRNWDSYGHKIMEISEHKKNILCDPQTSGGLLIAIDPRGLKDFERIMKEEGLGDFIRPIGSMKKRLSGEEFIKVRSN